MNDKEQRTRFDLAQFVLTYLEHEGSLVTPPSYGACEVLLPEELAAALHVDSYMKLAFDDRGENAEDALRISVNHPLVEAIAERIMQKTGNAQVFINHVRLEKKGLFDLAFKKFRITNARLTPKKGAEEQATLHHYLRCNFKVAFLTHEKQEHIISVVMDVQGGYAIQDDRVLAQLTTSETTPAFADMTTAKPRWIDVDEPLSSASLDPLLERAREAVQTRIAEQVKMLQTRMQRYLELDLARIEDYYDALEKDLQRRLERTDPKDEERRRALEDKHEALRNEYAAKMADIRARYRLRIALELINVQIIGQPKVTLEVQISNRRTTITRFAVWDPLVHRLEPLTCDVCGRPGEELHLCVNGHLAHQECMAPQCIECKREYCQLCAEEVLTCAVCGQPVCRASIVRCPECGRGTCQEHKGLCHAANGEPVSLADLQPVEIAPEPKPEPPVESTPKRTSAPPAKKPHKRKTKSAHRNVFRSAKGTKINVEVYQNIPRIVAYVMRSARRVLAVRTIELTSGGIEITCDCERIFCLANGQIYRPESAKNISRQIQTLLADLRQEYQVPSNRVEYFYLLSGGRMNSKRILILPSVWRNSGLIQQVQKNFDAHSRHG